MSQFKRNKKRPKRSKVMEDSMKPLCDLDKIHELKKFLNRDVSVKSRKLPSPIFGNLYHVGKSLGFGNSITVGRMPIKLDDVEYVELLGDRTSRINCIKQ